MAFATALPVWRSHKTVVSRWLVMPMAEIFGTAARVTASRAVCSWVCQIASGSCSTSPGLG